MTKPREFYIYEGESVTGEVLRVIRDKDAGNLGPYWKDAIHVREVTEEPAQADAAVNLDILKVLKSAEKRFAHIENWHRDFVTPDNFSDCQDVGMTPESYLRDGKNEIRAAIVKIESHAQADRISIKKSLWDRMVVFINTNYNGNKECHMLCEDVQAAEREK